MEDITLINQLIQWCRKYNWFYEMILASDDPHLLKSIDLYLCVQVVTELSSVLWLIQWVVFWGLMPLLNILSHIATMPGFSSGTQVCHAAQVDMTPHPVTVYRHGANLLLCYPLTLEYTTTHFNILGQTRLGNHSPTFHTHQRMLNAM